MKHELIDQLIQGRGIGDAYIDAWGNPCEVTQGVKENVLSALGYNLFDEHVLTSQVEDEIDRYWSSALNPVQVVKNGEPVYIAVRLPISFVNSAFALQFVTESGESWRFSFTPMDYELIGAVDLDDEEYQEYAIELKNDCPLGYHKILLTSLETPQQALAEMRFIVTPSECFVPEPMLQGQKYWGFNVQLYCLRSEKNWGIGDFSDLLQLLNYSAQWGASFVGVNPIHALYPNQPDMCSPYSPSSRRWLNMGYIDVEQVSGFTHTSIQEWFLQSEIQSNLADLRSLELVDYTGVISLKMAALKRLFQLFKQNESEENKQQQVKFAEFVGAGGDSLLTQCVYDAIQEKMTETQVESWGWPVFPPEYQNPDSEQVAAFKNDHGELIEFYQFVQWQSAKQLQRVTHTANTLNMEVGLYGDIAVGAAQGSAQVWANQDLYRTQASIGAPPDVLGPQGQNWGLPPMDPVRLYEQGYQPFIDILSANMQYFGAVRIDHVMGLLRLWWVPQHEQATEGCYIHYPVDDLLGILALESHRNRTLVIGEDLGTVPDSIREKLQQWGIFSYKVFLFEKAPDGGFTSPQHYPSHSLSTLVTHDMPTLKGYWHCLDLVLGKELGVYQDENVLQQLYGSRHDDKQRILDSVHWHGCLPDWVSKWADKSEMNTALNHGLQTHMAQGNSALLSVQLEDWIEMDRPVNVPGTYQEYPNWRRKLDLTLTEIFNLENCTVLAERLSQARKSSNG